MIKGVESLLS